MTRLTETKLSEIVDRIKPFKLNLQILWLRMLNNNNLMFLFYYIVINIQ